MTTDLDDYDRKRADGYHARLSTACFSLGELESLIKHPKFRTEDELARVALELRVALLGSDEERAALDASRRRVGCAGGA